MNNPDEFEYVGFWIRVVATIIDSFAMMVIVFPIMFAVYGLAYFDIDQPGFKGLADIIVSDIFPIVAVIVFWVYFGATPGKMVFSAKIVDTETGEPPSAGQCIGRYFAYILSILPLGLGFIWVAFDSRKQGWHDKLAGTVVVRPVRPPAVFHPQR